MEVRGLPRQLGAAQETPRSLSAAQLVLLHALGFDERRRGSHRIFTKQGIPEIINLQPRADRTAKPYQVRQVRNVVLNRGLASRVRKEDDDER